MPDLCRTSFAGAFWGTVTVLCWASFNVAAKAGTDAGMSPQALSFLRYATPGVFAFLVLAWMRYQGQGATVPLRRLIVLAALGGPLFGLTAVSGYQFAPLSHGLLFAPVAVFVAGTVFSALLLKEQITGPRILGALIMFGGLGLLVGFEVQSVSRSWATGIALFVTAGLMWGGYTVLLRHWRVPLLEGTAAVVSLSAVFAAVFLGPLAWSSLSTTEPAMLGLQFLIQGVIGGVVSVFALMAALRRLTVQTVAMLPTFTPAVALLIAWGALGARPALIELAGAGLIFLGFSVSRIRGFPLRTRQPVG